MQKTRLGWAMGRSMAMPEIERIHCNLLVGNNLDSKLQRFWELEEIP